MGLIAREPEGGDFELTPAGAFVARCYGVVDLGLQESNYQGQTNIRRKVRISWELPTELMSDGRPFSISQNYTLSLSEKARLYGDLVSWRGKKFTQQELDGFDLFTIVGAPCLINIIHNTDNQGKTWANVSSISPLPRGMECPPAVNPPLTFSLDEYTSENFAELPDWLQKKINLDLVEGEPHPDIPAGQSLPPADFDDDIPF